MNGFWVIRKVAAYVLILGLSIVSNASADTAADSTVMPPEIEDFLQKLEGTWTVDAKSFSEQGDVLVDATDGTAEYRWEYDGKLIEKMELITSEGIYRGIGIYSYDFVNRDLKYVWIANGDTGVMITEGNLDEPGNVLVSSARWPSAVTLHNVSGESRVSFIGDDKYQYMLYAQDGAGNDYLYSHLIFTRR